MSATAEIAPKLCHQHQLLCRRGNLAGRGCVAEVTREGGEITCHDLSLATALLFDFEPQ